MATVLIVDDVRDNREFLVTLLRSRGHRVLEAVDGSGGLAAVRAEHPALVITDILMPVMDGYEFVRQLRLDPTTRATPVVFYTAYYGDREARALTQASGADWVLTKPAVTEDVLTTVDRALAGESAPAAPPASVAPSFDREHLRLLTHQPSEKVGDLRSANARLRGLINVALELASERDPERLLQRVCTAARDLFGATYITLGVVDAPNRAVQRCVTCGAGATDCVKVGGTLSGLLKTVVDERRTVRGDNLDGDPVAIGLPPSHPEVRTFLATPMASSDHVYGWICFVGNEGRSFTDDDQQLVVALGGLVGRIYESSDLHAVAETRTEELEHEMLKRRAAEAAARHERNRAQRYLDTADVILVALDLDQRITLINRKGCDVLGMAEHELLGRDWVEACLPTRTHDALRRQLRDVANGDLSLVENLVVTRTGEERLIEWRNTVLRDDEGHICGTFSSGSDITERRRIHEQLRQAQKMEAVGQLAGGVAHDFNNLLTAILGYSELLTEQIGPDKPIGQDLQEIMHAARRAAALTERLLAFSRRKAIEVSALDVNQVIGSVEALLRRLIGEQITIRTTYASGLRPVLGDASQLEQVLINLAVNARDAMPQGGMLTIETRNVDLDAHDAATHAGARPGAYTLMRIGDTGTGMTPAIQARIFEPFFTTKDHGRGTGLGLAAVFAIVQQLDGYVHVDSEPGRGTVFDIYLPETHQPVQMPVTAPADVPTPGNETILLVEDDDVVRAFVKTVLQRFGYRVFETPNAEAAVKLVETSTDPIDLLLTDVVLPKMDGPELAGRITHTHPSAHVLFISGYPEQMASSEARHLSKLHVLEKPFTAQSLLARVRQVLG